MAVCGIRSSRDFGQRGEAAGLWFIQQAAAVRYSRSNQNGVMGSSLPHAIDIQFAAEPPHGDLKRLRPAVGLELSTSPSRMRSFAGRARTSFDHFGDRGGHVFQAARVNDDVVARFVDLDARAVHFVFERGFAEHCQRFGDIVRRLRQHGLDGPK